MNIRERIDRAIANPLWRTAFPNAEVCHYDYAPFDHAPIVLNIFGSNVSMPRPFKFEKFWTREAGCFDVVAGAWNQIHIGSAGWRLAKKIRATRYALQKWTKKYVGNIQEGIKQLKIQLSRCQQASQTKEDLAME